MMRSSVNMSSSTHGLTFSPSDTFLEDEPSTHRPLHQRAASESTLQSFPSFDIPTFGDDFELDTSVFGQLTRNTEKPDPLIHPTMSAKTSPKPPPARPRTGPVVDRPRSWFPGTRSPRNASHEKELPRPSTSDRTSTESPDSPPQLERSATISDSLTSLAKRSWMASTRSPTLKSKPKSPGGKEASHCASDDEKTINKTSSSRKRPHLLDLSSVPRISVDGSKATTPKAIAKASSYFSKLKTKQIAMPLRSQDSDTSSATSYAETPATSTDDRTTPSISEESERTTIDEAADVQAPDDPDPLRSSFKMLEAEIQYFASRHVSQQISQAQEVLVPFLCRTSPDETIKDLSPASIHRRALVLDQWWTAILDMLDGKTQQPVPGVDRPFLLETLVMVMMRGEWRQSTRSYLALKDRSPRERARSRSGLGLSNLTTCPDGSVCTDESLEDKVRAIFEANLIKQMGIVVEKMSMRQAPLSLVNFAGKTCAYAFFFAPGVADILVRLWQLLPDHIGRAADAFGLPRKSKGESDDITALFPQQVADYAWSSHRTLCNMLRREPSAPLKVSRILWTGPWISRWRGRDTDLFFIFCKYFHVLADQFMPDDIPLVEKARAPAFVLVQAQLLASLDSALHRQPNSPQAQQLPLMDSANGADAALTMSLPGSNAMKVMADNAVIVLLRNVLSDEAPDVQGAKQTFAEAFGLLMKAAVRRTSRFDNPACFNLCDFLEEALKLYDEFEYQLCMEARVDWPFWFDVFKMLLDSCNTMSEVRVLSFIFSAWDVIARHPERKASLCVDWLLTPEIFDAFFNNWCPMVRAYYHRLLCWRICRDSGSANEVDTKIFLLVSARLQSVWAHYLYQKHDAALAGRSSPSTAPTLPTPGKKFIIIRQEVDTPQPGLFLGFDSFAKLPSHSTTTLDAAKSERDGKQEGKKRWSLIKMLGMGNGDDDDGDAPWNNTLRDRDLAQVRQETAEARTGSAMPPRPPPKGSQYSDPFSASPIYEVQKHVFRFILGWQQPAGLPRDRMLTRPRLPGPAQARVSARDGGDSSSPHVAGMPAATRTVSGSAVAGLISGARNASPSNVTTDSAATRPTATLQRTASTESATLSDLSDDTAFLVTDAKSRSSGSLGRRGSGLLMEPATKPIKPTGSYAKNAVYNGRALAEWSLVVFECNNFVDRRREEGVLGLSEVEVPVLGVEGFRKVGG